MAPSVPNGTSQPNSNSSKPFKAQTKSYSSKYNLPPHFIGGNHLKAALSGSVKDFVANNDGHTVITSVGKMKMSVILYVFAD